MTPIVQVGRKQGHEHDVFGICALHCKKSEQSRADPSLTSWPEGHFAGRDNIYIVVKVRGLRGLTK